MERLKKNTKDIFNNINIKLDNRLWLKCQKKDAIGERKKT